jgi:hypothetical protein
MSANQKSTKTIIISETLDNWLIRWANHNFDLGTDPNKVMEYQKRIQNKLTTSLKKWDKKNGANHSIEKFNWEQLKSNHSKYILNVSIKPKATITYIKNGSNGHGGGNGTISPTPPPPPKPPY